MASATSIPGTQHPLHDPAPAPSAFAPAADFNGVTALGAVFSGHSGCLSSRGFSPAIQTLSDSW